MLRPGSRAWVLLTLCVVVSARADSPQADPTTPLKNLSLEELSQIEVTTVSKEPTPAFRTPAAVFVLNRDDIRRSGATSVPDVLRLVPGVDVARIDSNKWAIGIRGFQGRLSRSVLVLIDGRSVYTPLFAGVYWEVQNMMLEDVERIEVVRGPGATIWGSNAVNGVINIITRNSRDTYGMLVSAAAGNVEQGSLAWRYGGGDDRFSYRLYGMGFTRSPMDHADDRNFDDWRMGQVGFRMDWAPTPRDSVTVQGDVYGTLAGSKLAISTYNPPQSIALEDNGFYNGQNILTSWRRRLASGSDLELRAYFDRTDRQDLNYREVRETVDVDLIHHIPTRRHDVIWGVGVRTSPSQYTQTRETVDFLPHQQTYNLASGFAQDEIALVPDRLSLTLGTKLEHNSFSGFEVQPTGRLSWTPDDRNTLWTAFTRAVRTPSRIEEGFRYTALAVPAIPLYLRLIGDGDFHPEQLVGYELGYRRYFRRKGFVAVNGFHNRYNRLLSVENLPPRPETDPAPAHLVLPIYLRNGIRANATGVEVSALWDVRRWWRVRGSYTFLGLDAARRAGSNDASTVRQLEGDSPSNKSVLQSWFNLRGGFQLDLTLRQVGAVPDQAAPAYTTGDVRFSRSFERGFELSVVGRDLLQPTHIEYSGEPGGPIRIKRSAYLKLTWTR